MAPDRIIEGWQRDLAAEKLKIPALRKAIKNEKDPKLKAGMQDQLVHIQMKIEMVKMHKMMEKFSSRPKIRDGWKRTRSRRPPGPTQPR